jgi:hypothetical protein
LARAKAAAIATRTIDMVFFMNGFLLVGFGHFAVSCDVAVAKFAKPFG